MKKLFLLLMMLSPVFLHAADQTPAEQLGWKLAIHSYTFQKFSIFDAIDMTAALGVKYMSISGSVLMDGHFAGGSRSHRQKAQVARVWEFPKYRRGAIARR
jgi:hypothetical protein